jgi:hypothetical protein
MVGVSGNGNIGNIGPLTGWTQLSEVDHGNQTSRCDRLTTATATDFDIGFSQAIGQTAVIAGAAISEVVAGGPPTLTALSASLITATGARLTVTA